MSDQTSSDRGSGNGHNADPNDPFHSFHTLAAILVLSSTFYATEDIVDDILHLSLLGKYGFIVSIIICCHGIKFWVCQIIDSITNWFDK